MTIAPLLEQDYPVNHSTQFNLSWAFQYQRQFFGGQFYPRWLEYSNFGFGNATFVFYPPLSLVATLPFAAFHSSVSASLVGSMTIALVVFALGIYGYGNCFFQKSTSLILTIVSLFNPYLLINLYQRGAIAEVWGMAWIPWILGFTHLLVWSCHIGTSRLKRSLYILGLALSYSGLILSHLPTLLLFTLVWMVFPWCLNSQSLSHSGGGYSNLNRSSLNPKKGILESYLSLCIGIGLSSFYLLPAWLDQPLVQLENLHPDRDYYPQNRLLITGLMRLSPQVSTHWFDQTIVPYFLTVIILFFLGFLAWILISQIKIPQTVLIFKKNHPYFNDLNALNAPIDLHHRDNDRHKALNQGSVLWWCLTLLITIVMVTDLGRIFYFVPLLQKIQFSWRWLSVSIVPVSLLLGYIYFVFFHFGKSIFDQSFNQFFDLAFSRSSFRSKMSHSLIQLLALGLVSLLTLVLLIQGNQVMAKTTFNAAEIETFNTLSAQKTFPQEPHLSPQEPFLSWHLRFPDGLGLGDVYEYRAREVKVNLPPSDPVPLAQWVNPGSGAIEIEQWHYGKRSIQVTNTTAQEQRLRLRQLYYPGWQFQISGQPWRSVLGSEEGLAEIPIPPGSHKTIVAYRGTLAEFWGKGLTLLTLIILGSILLSLGGNPCKT